MTIAMNYREFKRQLMIDPYDRSQAFMAAQAEDFRCADLARRSDQLETSLRQALEVQPPADWPQQLTAQITGAAGSEIFADNAAGERRFVGWLPAMAAGLAMGAGLAATVLFLNSEEPTLQDFVVEHWQYDGAATELMARQSPMQTAGNARILAILQLTADPSLMEAIVYSRNCGTPHGNGIHLVMDFGADTVSVLYIPDAQLSEDATYAQTGATRILLSNASRGVIVLFGENQHSLDRALQMLQAELEEQQQLV